MAARSTNARRSGRQDDLVCLVGSTRLQDFIDFVHERSLGAKAPDDGELADKWRQAERAYQGLQTLEAGEADAAAVTPLPKSMQGHVRKLVLDPGFGRSFQAVPVSFGMVELDRLVVTQRYVELSAQWTRQALSKLAKPAGAALAKLCLPLTDPPMPLEVMHDDGEKFVFRSSNHDVRVLGHRILPGSAIQGLDLPGHAKAVLCVALGFGVNALSAVRYGKRLLLHNGYHRAYLLRAMGVTHVPCIIQVCEHWEDVQLAGAEEAFQNPHPYFEKPRPPLLKDFFDRRLTHRVAARPMGRVISLELTSEKWLWPQ
jgi:hypothetical protein